MYPLVTPKANLLVTPRATTPGTPKMPVNPSYRTTRDINLLSPNIDINSYLYRSKKSVTPERITPKNI